MRICHIGWANSIHVQRWVTWFARRGHESILITDRAMPIDGIRVVEIPQLGEDHRPRWQRIRGLSIHDWRVTRLREVWWLRQMVRKIQPNIVHSHTLLYPGYLGAFAGYRPYVITVFNGDVLWKMYPGLLHDLRTRWALLRARLVTGDTELLIQACQRLGAEPEGTKVIVGGSVDRSWFKLPQNREEIKQNLGIAGHHVVLSPRSTAPLYNLNAIVNSIPTVLSAIHDVLFVFIWANAHLEYERELREQISKMGVDHVVILRGKVPYDEIHCYYQAADIVVSVPFHDNLSRCILEGMACGAVPVVSDLPTLREWVTNDWNGLLVNPYDLDQIATAISSLLLNDDKRQTFGRRNDEMMRERGDQDMWMGRMEALYRSLLSPEDLGGKIPGN